MTRGKFAVLEILSTDDAPVHHTYQSVDLAVMT